MLLLPCEPYVSTEQGSVVQVERAADVGVAEADCPRLEGKVGRSPQSEMAVHPLFKR